VPIFPLEWSLVARRWCQPGPAGFSDCFEECGRRPPGCGRVDPGDPGHHLEVGNLVFLLGLLGRLNRPGHLSPHVSGTLYLN